MFQTLTEVYFQESEQGIFAYEGVGPYTDGQDRVFHSYYQWVALMLFFQGILYYSSHLWWVQV